jgi:hypothetical protein
MPQVGRVKYSVKDSNGTEITQGEAPVSPAFGSFDIALELPYNIAYGNATINFVTSSEDLEHEYQHTFSVEQVFSDGIKLTFRYVNQNSRSSLLCSPIQDLEAKQF